MLKFNLFVAGLILLNAIAIAIYHRLTILKSLKWDERKFQLYALRDEFINLIVKGELALTPRTQEAYEFINQSIVAVEEVEFRHLVALVIKSYKQVRAYHLAGRDERVWNFEVRAVRMLIEMVLSKDPVYRVIVFLSTKDGLGFLALLKRKIRERELLKEQREFSQAYKWTIKQGTLAVAQA